jgi:TonB family protein
VRLRPKSGCANLELARGPDPVSSAIDIANPITEVEGKEGETSAQANPVPLEEKVSVTGTKGSGGSASRDLFSEETTTVLVFRDGAVIRLSAPVSEGQLIFLTLKKTNQEVICEVLGKRSGTPGPDYVKLQFTEERGDYWGVAFPQGEPDFKLPAIAPAREKVAPKPAASLAQREAEEDGDQLDAEVQALRKQLLGFEKKKVDAVSVKAPIVKEELAPVNDPAPVRVVEEKPELLMPPAKEKEEAPRPVIGMALPTVKKAVEERDPSEDLLPEPELDFSQVPKIAPNVDGLKPFRGPVIGRQARTVGLSVVLVVALGVGSWYAKWWQYLPAAKKAATPVGAVRPVATRSAAAGSVKAAASAQTNAVSGPGVVVAEAKDSKSEQQSAGEVVAEEAAPVKEQAQEADGDSPKSDAQEEPAKKEDSAEANVAPAAESAASDAEVLPAKLLKPVNPVYPPDAMRGYITGDVKAEVSVEASGHVGEVKVISGPAALREAAVAALRQYEYAPAMQGGKAVGSKTVEVVKFWFNP